MTFKRWQIILAGGVFILAVLTVVAITMRPDLREEAAAGAGGVTAAAVAEALRRRRQVAAVALDRAREQDERRQDAALSAAEVRTDDRGNVRLDRVADLGDPSRGS